MSPLPLQLIRRLGGAASARIGELRLRGLARALQRAPASPAALMPIVARLRAHWGNPVWSADLGCLEEVVSRALVLPGPFLECGAGVSTVVLGAIAARRGTSVWTLEQDRAWVRTMRRRLALAGLGNVHVLHAPLTPVEGGVWYALDQAAQLPRAFPLVFCDGPSVGPSRWPEPLYRAWRSRLVPELARRGIGFRCIVLDDEQDERCPLLLETWHAAGLSTETVSTPYGRHVVAQPPAPAPAAAAP